jgi:hypothetical protein
MTLRPVASYLISVPIMLLCFIPPLLHHLGLLVVVENALRALRAKIEICRRPERPEAVEEEKVTAAPAAEKYQANSRADVEVICAPPCMFYTENH